jgi:putative transposase
VGTGSSLLTSSRIRVRYRADDEQFVDTVLDRVVVDEVTAGLPVREFRSYKGQRHYSGWFFSTTMNRLIAYESRLELARLLVADFDPRVVGIAGQPFQLIGADGPRIRRHVPDVLLASAEGDVRIVDVKPAHRLADPEVQALHSWVRLRGWGFEEWSGCGRTRLENIRFLAGYRRPATVSVDLVAEVVGAVGAGCSVLDVECRLRRHPSMLVRQVVMHLLWRGVLASDLERALDRGSMLTPTGQAWLTVRCAAKAEELGVTERTVRRWIQAYRREGEVGLLDDRKVGVRGHTLDPRWEQACREIVSEQVRGSTRTDSARLRLIEERLEDQYGAGAVSLPSRATAYRHLERITRGTNTRRGSAKGRRSIADRPKGTYGRLRATRPGEYVILDTQSLDVFAMEPVTLRWIPAQVTVAQDLFTRAVLAVRVTAVSTKAVDVAGLLYEALTPTPAPGDWPVEARWPYHGIPEHLVFDEREPDHDQEGRTLRGVPVCPPETLVVDHGKVFLSAHVIGVCTRLGVSIQPARPYQGSDKPTVERFFKTLREDLIQYLPAYKGPDVYSRGEAVEDAAFLYVHELEDVIREWLALVYHRRRHTGLALPQWPRAELSPNEMFEIGIAKAGLLRVPRDPDLLYDFFECRWRTIQHYGVDVDGLRFNGPALDAYRDAPSPYGGRYAGKWPIRFNPDDVRTAYFQDPGDLRWHRLDWEHAWGLDTPFSCEAAAYLRRHAARSGRAVDTERALGDLLARWKSGMVLDRRERRMAARISAETAAPTSRARNGTTSAASEWIAAADAASAAGRSDTAASPAALSRA